MDTLKKRNILEEILTEDGYSEWRVVEPNRLNSEDCLVFNPKEKTMGDVSIPDEWLDDPCQRSAIKESLALAIQNSRRILPQAHLSSSNFSTDQQNNARDEENNSNGQNLLSAGATKTSKRKGQS